MSTGGRYAGTFQTLDPDFKSDWIYVYSEWRDEYKQPKRLPHKLHRGEVVLVLEDFPNTYLKQVLCRHGFVYVSASHFFMPGYASGEEVPWVVEQRDKEWYFGT